MLPDKTVRKTEEPIVHDAPLGTIIGTFQITITFRNKSKRPFREAKDAIPTNAWMQSIVKNEMYARTIFYEDEIHVEVEKK